MTKPIKRQHPSVKPSAPPVPTDPTDSRLSELREAFNDATRALTRLGNSLNHYYYDSEQLSATEKLKAAKDVLKDYD